MLVQHSLMALVTYSFTKTVVTFTQVNVGVDGSGDGNTATLLSPAEQRYR